MNGKISIMKEMNSEALQGKYHARSFLMINPSVENTPSLGIYVTGVAKILFAIEDSKGN
jgi:hypothetical protein